jgi:hypothetical protein
MFSIQLAICGGIPDVQHIFGNIHIMQKIAQSTFHFSGALPAHEKPGNSPSPRLKSIKSIKET